jgi:hypothetical protein
VTDIFHAMKEIFPTIFHDTLPVKKIVFEFARIACFLPSFSVPVRPVQAGLARSGLLPSPLARGGPFRGATPMAALFRSFRVASSQFSWKMIANRPELQQRRRHDRRD